ncbi:type I phosphodiesterase / nucleotide pyrophosphatase [Ruminiclostridium hungatei]|uniref:Type I phosphodiesterase / nucleotide pyrophosphatase n=1 Tax=Ruminiclostridium hungatei TaxID=48256 RepID=A0A1V4SLT8_RUMHU|nr:ectonucleotide pyrophosphatase/phosphodiesterase [Ruminiclostridium hungatei]OPX44753.1 type I phosphodiesterase / nucleotide pyrophosphatase [Ruminiclostridium hungatei]
MRAGKSKHLVVISYDAFSEDNWEKASKLPNLSELIKNGAYSTKLKSVYPTLTYVAHTTMVTGVYPDKHGIYHNNPFQPFISEKEQSWFWFKKDIKVPAVYDALKKHRMKSAGILWPVTGRASIRYNIPEIRAIKKENQALKIIKNGSPFFSMGMEKKFGHFRRGIEQPYLDDFTTRCAVDTIKRKRPNLLLMHLIDLDDAKHEHGIDSPDIDKVLVRMDKRLGDIMEAVREAGIEEDTVFLVIGDHGQINVRYKVRLNQLLKEAGLIYEEKGEMKWRAYIQNAGGAAYLHLKENDSEAEQRALDILKKAMTEECYGIERIYGRKELHNYHVAYSVRYMLEAKTGYCFEDSLEDPVVTDLEELGIKYATHGFSPDKSEYKCILVISGDCIKNEYQLGEIQMVDIAPTIANILGIDFYNCDGRALNEIFRQGQIVKQK